MTAAFAIQIELDASGVAWIGGTTTKVIEVVADTTAHGLSPEEVHFQHPHLSYKNGFDLLPGVWILCRTLAAVRHI